MSGNVKFEEAGVVGGRPVSVAYPLPVQIISGGGASSPNKTEDTAAASGDTGTAVMAIQTASPADAASAGDYAFLQMAGGRLWTNTSIGHIAGTPIAAAGPSTGSAAAAGLPTVSQNMVSRDGGTTFDPVTSPNAVSRILSAANTTNATSAKASAGRVHRIIAFNAGTASFLKLYNKASAPTVGTDTPILTIYLAANTQHDIDLSGHFFSAGIAYALTLNGADADNTAVAAAAVLGLNITYS